MGAPRSMAASRSSRTRAAAPSPMTKPSRPASKGREAFSGSSLRVDRAFMAAKAAIPTRVTAASLPPHTTESTRPARIRSSPSPIAWADAEQAVTVQEL